jgi:hypothetical protein
LTDKCEVRAGEITSLGDTGLLLFLLISAGNGIVRKLTLFYTLDELGLAGVIQSVQQWAMGRMAEEYGFDSWEV